MKVILAVLVILPLAFTIPDKRFLLGPLLQGDELKSLVSQLVTLAGSEETEHTCEMECHSLVQHNNLLQHGCPLVCRSLQSLAHGFGIPHPSKRLILDTLFQGDELKSLVSTLVSLAGSEETEHKCEMECHALVQQNHLLQFACPLVCKSLQSLAHRFGISHPSTHSKRLLIDTLFQGDELKSLVSQLVATAGSEETEHKCEMECHALVQQNHLLQFACPLVCKSLQSLAHRFGIQHPSKRSVLDTLFQGDELKSLVTKLVAMAGSDETEHQCEVACHSLVQHNNLLQFACPLVCKSLQSLAHRFGITHPSTHSKRLLVYALSQGDELKNLVSQLVATAGSEETEHKCEMECHALVQQNHLLQFACPLVCKSLQSLAHRFGITHPSTHSKRILLDTIFQGDELKNLVSQLVATAGSEETEHKCEMECHALVQQNHLLQFACPLVCKSLQSLAHRFGIQHPSKRLLLDTLFQGDELKSLVTKLVALAGSDETEHQCETACHSLVQHNNLLQFACPLVCKSLQSLAHRYGIQHPSKRFLLDTLFQGDELKSLVTQLVALVGSDETEHQCEMACHSLVQHNNLLQFACPLVCKSLQSLTHRFGIPHPSTDAKRLLLDTLFQGDELKSLVSTLVSLAGSEETEHKCETECHSLVQQNHLLQHGCPLICRSLQSLAHSYGISHPNVVPQKRLILDTLLQGVDLKVLLTQMASTLASDSTEIACESQCHHLIQTDHLLQFGCPLICKSFQSLVHRLGIHAPVVNMHSTTATTTTTTPTTATLTTPTKMA